MDDETGRDIYAELGLRPVINAGGSTTTWGGSTPSAAVKEAMTMADAAWVDMAELHDRAGAAIAATLGVEAAHVTAGCYSAMALAAAACMAGNDPKRRARLPDTSGMKNEILLQRAQRYGFAKAYLAPGARLVEIGGEAGCTAEQLEEAIGPRTAAVAYFVMPDWGDGVLTLEETIRIAQARGVPVVADAASRIYPLDYFRATARSADLVCFAGKYLHAPQSTWFVCGKRDLVEAASAQGFPFGRAMKLDRQEIIGLVVALEQWFSLDHDDRFASYNSRFAEIKKALDSIASVREAKVIEVSRHPGVTLHAVLDTEALGKQAQQVVEELLAGNPRVRVLTAGNDTLNINVHTLKDGEANIVAERLATVLT